MLSVRLRFSVYLHWLNASPVDYNEVYTNGLLSNFIIIIIISRNRVCPLIWRLMYVISLTETRLSYLDMSYCIAQPAERWQKSESERYRVKWMITKLFCDCHPNRFYVHSTWRIRVIREAILHTSSTPFCNATWITLTTATPFSFSIKLTFVPHIIII